MSSSAPQAKTKRASGPPNAMARTTLEDVIHYYVERILQTRKDRRECYDSLAYFWGLHPAHDLYFGYHYVRIRLAELMVQGSSGSKFVRGSGVGGGVESGDRGGDPPDTDTLFANWTRQDWLDLSDDLKETVDLAYRRDATVELADVEDDNLEDERPTRRPDWLEESYQPLQDIICMSAILAPIRTELEAVATGAATALQDEASLNEIVEYVEREVTDEYIQEQCRRLYVRSEEEPAVYRLAGTTFLRQLVRKTKSQRLQDNLEKLVQRVAFEVFGTREPELIKLRYRLPSVDGGSQEERGARAQVRALRVNRHALNENVRDPLEEIRGAPKREAEDDDRADPNSRKKRRSIELTFDDDDESSLNPPPQLSELQPPRPKRSLFASHRLDKEYPPDDGLFDRNGNVTKRIPWSDEEKEAVKKGVEIFGLGKWSDIKKHFREVLHNRTSVQIKDAWRTLQQKGEVNPGEFTNVV